MKSFCILASLFAAMVAQSNGLQFTDPSPGAILHPRQPFTIEIVAPIGTTVQEGVEEVSLTIGVVSCGASPCPQPSADLGELIFNWKFQSQGSIGEDMVFDNFTFIFPPDMPSGPASIQAQHVYSKTSDSGDSQTGVEYASVAVEVP